MCTVLLPPGVNPTAVNKCISYHIISYIKWRWVCSQRSKTAPLDRRTKECHTSIRFSVYLGSEVPSEEDYYNSLSPKKKLYFVNNKFLLVLVNTHNPPTPTTPPPRVHITRTSDFVWHYVLNKQTSTKSDDESCRPTYEHTKYGGKESAC